MARSARFSRSVWIVCLTVVTLALAMPKAMHWLSQAGKERVARWVEQRGGRVAFGGEIDWSATGRATLRALHLAHPKWGSIDIAQVQLRPAWRQLLLGNAAIASAQLDGVVITFADGVHQIYVDEVRVRRADGHRLRIAAQVAGGWLDGVLQEQGDDWTLEAEVAQLDLGQLPQSHDASVAGEVSGALEVTESRGGKRLQAHAQLISPNLFVSAAWLAPEPVAPLAVALTTSLVYAPAAHKLTIGSAELEVAGAARFDLAGAVVATRGGAVELEGSFACDDMERLVVALPHALSVPNGVPPLRGELSARAAVSGTWQDPFAWNISATLDSSDLAVHAQSADPTALSTSFVYTPPSGLAFEVGPENGDFVPLAELPEYVPRAVTTSEDAGFFAHSGFDFDELKNSALAVVQAGRAVRGGSTITQQLAKNLFLSRKKTYARKLREALVTLALEAALPKDRLLEIYLNIIEWGPGVYGIGQAAHAYFGKDARLLSPKEAAFLATIIPNPIRYHVYFERKELTDNWQARVDELLAKMNAAGKLDAEAYARALAAPLDFVSN